MYCRANITDPFLNNKCWRVGNFKSKIMILIVTKKDNCLVDYDPKSIPIIFAFSNNINPLSLHLYCIIKLLLIIFLFFYLIASLLNKSCNHTSSSVMIKEKQYIENKSSSSSSERGDPGASNDNQMIKTPDNNSGDLHHDLGSIIIKNESDMTALIENTGGDVADSKSCVGGGSSSNTSPGSSNTDQKQLMSNDISLSQSIL